MERFIYRVRRAIYRFAFDYIKPDPPILQVKPEVGDTRFAEAKFTGEYRGSVKMPKRTKLVDTSAFALVMASNWMVLRAEDQGMSGVLLSEAFEYTIKYEIDYRPINPMSTGLQPMDPAGIRQLIVSMLEAAQAEPDVEEEESEPATVIQLFGIPGGKTDFPDPLDPIDPDPLDTWQEDRP